MAINSRVRGELVKIVHLIRDNGGEIFSQQGTLLLEMSLALGLDPKVILAHLTLLRRHNVLIIDKQRDLVYNAILLPNWESSMAGEFDISHEDDDMTLTVDVTEPVVAVPSGDDLDYDQLAHALLKHAAEVISQGQVQQAPVPPQVIVKELSAQDRNKIREAERVLERFIKLNEDHEKLTRDHKTLKDLYAHQKHQLDGVYAQLKEQRDKSDMDTHRELMNQLQAANNQIETMQQENQMLDRSLKSLKRELHQRSGASVAERVSEETLTELNSLKETLLRQQRSGEPMSTDEIARIMTQRPRSR